MHETTWADLATATPIRRWELRFDTPVTFRSGNRSTPLPQPHTMLTNLAAI